MQGHAIYPYAVPAGEHRVEVLFSGCCGLTGGTNVISAVRNSVLTIQYWRASAFERRGTSVQRPFSNLNQE